MYLSTFLTFFLPHQNSNIITSKLHAVSFSQRSIFLGNPKFMIFGKRKYYLMYNCVVGMLDQNFKLTNSFSQ